MASIAVAIFSLIVAVVGGIPSLGLSVGVAEIISVLSEAIYQGINAIIERQDRGKGARVELYIGFGYVTFQLMYIIGSAIGRFRIQWITFNIPYAYFCRFPRVIWNR